MVRVPLWEVVCEQKETQADLNLKELKSSRRGKRNSLKVKNKNKRFK